MGYQLLRHILILLVSINYSSQLTTFGYTRNPPKQDVPPVTILQLEEKVSSENENDIYCQLSTTGMLFCKNSKRSSYVEANENTFPELIEPYSAIDITHINMQDNFVHIIAPGVFNNFRHLKYIDLSSNNIKYLPKEIFNTLSNLNRLNLAKNNISVIEEDCFLGIRSLKELYLNDNQIPNMSFLDGCEKLEILDLSKNKIKEIRFPNYPWNLLYLNISHNNIEVIPRDVFKNMNLNSLDISHNNLSKIEGNDLKSLENLEKLDLSGNPLFRDDYIRADIFQYVPQINTLNLSNTGIYKIILGTFSLLNRLETLDLSKNSLQVIPNGIFDNLSSLRKLYVNGNLLNSIPYIGSPVLTELNVNDNLWNCGALLALTRSYPKVYIIPGDNYDVSNLHGISCDGVSDFISVQQERDAVIGIQRDMKEIIQELKTISSKLSN